VPECESFEKLIVRSKAKTPNDVRSIGDNPRKELGIFSWAIENG
jgi:hypothetical protein